MDNNIFETHEIFLTPLSPIHIGCGHDLVATDYYVLPDKLDNKPTGNGAVYFFDKSNVELSDKQRNDLLYLTRSQSEKMLLKLYRFVLDNYETFEPYTKAILKADKLFFEKYNSVLNNPSVENKLEVLRCCYINKSGLEQPYIPGSSLKGAIKTALLDRKNGGATIKDNSMNYELEKRLLGGTFDKSPMSLVKVSDLMPFDDKVYSKIIQVQQGKNDAIPSFIEVINQARYRSFHGTITFTIDVKKDIKKPFSDTKDFSKCMLDFYEPRISNIVSSKTSEMKGYTRKWYDMLHDLLKRFEPKFENGTAFLTRIGRYQGVDSITFPLGKDKIPKVSCYSNESVNQNYNSDLKVMNMPLGLALVEIDPKENDKALDEFCTKVRDMENGFNYSKKRTKILKERG